VSDLRATISVLRSKRQVVTVAI